ncbi:hypothetical protein [Actinokineospora sp. HUAS TT18]|uniref:hypothetical protein n=1 Tax=Actinokineospora sp. HUAS TT18 TaxID=3447451 RepID=UPI003F5206DB
MSGDDVTIRDTRFLNGLIVEAPAERVTIEFSEIQSGLSIASVRGVVVRNTDIWGGRDLVHVTGDRGFRVSDVLFDTVWAHNPALCGGCHTDGMQVRGVNNMTVRNSTFDMGPDWHESLNAALFFENANGGNTNVVLTGNHLDGVAGYTLRVGTGDHSGLVLTGNRFGPDEPHWGGECLFVSVTPTKATDNLRLADGKQARGCPIVSP